MQVNVPPRSADIQDDRDLARRVADLEALIEEARRRARRRRRRNSAAVVLVVAAGAAALIGFAGHGGGGAGSAATAHARASSRSVGGGSAAVVAPPNCSEASTSRVNSGGRKGHALWVALPTIWTDGTQPTFMRFCGPARVKLRAQGRSLQIRSGYCNASQGYWQYQLYVGLKGRVPAAPALFLELAVHNPLAVHGGAFPALAYMQLGGRTFGSAKPSWRLLSPLYPAPLVAGTITRATVTIAESLHAGAFAFRLRDATQITGSWTCA